MYMASLSVYFLLRVRFNISDSDIRKRYEIFLHGAPWILCLATSITGAAMKLFNPIILPEFGCWIGVWPFECLDPEIECERGGDYKENQDLVPWLLSFAWMFLAFFIVLVSNSLIYQSIRAQEKRNSAYGTADMVNRTASLRSAPSLQAIDTQPSSMAFSRSNRNGLDDSSQSRATLYRSMLYVSFTFFTAIWSFLPWWGNKVQVSRLFRLFFASMAQIFIPTQGVFNLFVYVRPRYLRLSSENPEWSWFKAIRTPLYQAP
mmetsp:Transcript_30011/g.49567  ORF Transcript_30011/g.49567 Transcript_30011/m.49567 type:complete len:261 (-) Transcript_30011:316-1098(-)